jgi:hypothetical protein
MRKLTAGSPALLAMARTAASIFQTDSGSVFVVSNMVLIHAS